MNNKYYSTFTTMNLGLDDFITSNFLTPERKCPKLDVYVCLFETTLLNFDEVKPYCCLRAKFLEHNTLKAFNACDSCRTAVPNLRYVHPEGTWKKLKMQFWVIFSLKNISGSTQVSKLMFGVPWAQTGWEPLHRFRTNLCF